MSAWSDFAKGLTTPFFDLISEVVTDKDKAHELAHNLATLTERQGHAERLSQMEVNKAEAGHRSVFVAGWRPFTGWVCASALASNYVVAPYVAAFFAVEIPTLDLAVMMPLLAGMLGLVGARSWEKGRGVTK